MASLTTLTQSLLELSFTGSFVLARVRQAKRAARRGDLSPLVTAVALDLLLGFAAAALLSSSVPPPRPPRAADALLHSMDLVVSRLRLLVTWLMDAPAGLKLNSVLSGALGRFFLYHIHLWVTFLRLSAPHVASWLGVFADTALPYAGLCAQVCVAQDAFNLVTFHVHCFYAYARRLFRSQTSGLLSLWRLFRGKKYNPLRERVDSLADNNVDQLFVGTLAFTILLFLYPTTLMYFAVFAPLRLAVVGVNAALSAVVRRVSRIHDYQGKVSSLL